MCVCVRAYVCVHMFMDIACICVDACMCASISVRVCPEAQARDFYVEIHVTEQVAEISILFSLRCLFWIFCLWGSFFFWGGGGGFCVCIIIMTEELTSPLAAFNMFSLCADNVCFFHAFILCRSGDSPCCWCTTMLAAAYCWRVRIGQSHRGR